MPCENSARKRSKTMAFRCTPEEYELIDRYDEYVPEELVRKGFAEGVLDIEGMKQRVLGWRDHA